MRTSIIVFPGSNCDRDVARAVQAAGLGPADLVWHEENSLPGGPELVVLPGGFSYGDYLRPGALAAGSPIMPAVREHAAGGGLVLGICNGFQILTEARLLPGALLPNAGLSFICRQACLKVERNDTPFSLAFEPGEVVRFPIAHHEGLFFLPPAELDALEKQGRVLFRYACGESGAAGAPWAPNGSLNGIAGILNEQGNVMGLMPHPERATLGHAGGGSDGRRFWKSLALWAAKGEGR